MVEHTENIIFKANFEKESTGFSLCTTNGFRRYLLQESGENECTLEEKSKVEGGLRLISVLDANTRVVVGSGANEEFPTNKVFTLDGKMAKKGEVSVTGEVLNCTVGAKTLVIATGSDIKLLSNSFGETDYKLFSTVKSEINPKGLYASS